VLRHAPEDHERRKERRREKALFVNTCAIFQRRATSEMGRTRRRQRSEETIRRQRGAADLAERRSSFARSPLQTLVIFGTLSRDLLTVALIQLNFAEAGSESLDVGLREKSEVNLLQSATAQHGPSLSLPTRPRCRHFLRFWPASSMQALSSPSVSL